MKKFTDFVKANAPGVILVLSIAILSKIIYQILPTDSLKNMISEVLIAIIFGFLINNIFHLPETFSPGIRFSLSKILRVGILLMGLRLSFQDIVSTGLTSIVLILACILLITLITLIIIKLKLIPTKLAILIGIGTTICGNSAIVAMSPVIDAKDEDTSFAIATITLFGIIAVIMYPLIGNLLGLSDTEFGLWAGTAINDTSQVIAAGSVYSQAALDVATVVKLIRNTLMVPIIILTGLLYNLTTQKSSGKKKTRISITSIIPWFVVGFLGMTLLRTLGISFGFFPKDVNSPNGLNEAASILKMFNNISRFLILLALSAIGLNTKLSKIIKIGFKPLLLGLTLSLILAIFSLLAISLFIF